MHPPIRFVTTSDGVRIAYSVHGEGAPLVFVRGWISHLEMHWDDPAYRAYFEALARHVRLVRYDARGNGLSQWDVPPVDLQALVRDLEAVVDELGASEVVLYGATFGGPIAVSYAALHPERVSKLILEGTYARGEEIAPPDRRAAIIETMRVSPEAGYLLLSHYSHPEPQQAAYRRPEVGPRLIAPAMAGQLYALGFQIDVTGLLPKITAPTLVLHRRRSWSIPVRLGVQVAAAIPNARLVVLEGTAHNMFEGDPAPALAAIGEFLGVRIEPPAGVQAEPAAADSRAPVTILFTDMEGSTSLTQRLGDAGAQELVRAHNDIVRAALRSHSGVDIKHTGDGIMASFPSASLALECAIAIQRALARHNQDHPADAVRVRIGLNVGEPVREEDDLFGQAVQLARRLCDRAAPGQILASNVVRELVAGKGFLFADLGDTELRGFEDPVRLYAVRWEEP